MKIEIDQSGKIENTGKHTYLALSNREHFVLKISSREKQKLQKHFRIIGKPNLFIYITFAALIIILMKNLRSKPNRILIDTEYPGRNHQIKNLLQALDPKISIDNVNFGHIGKKSRAHFLAYGTAIGKLRPDLLINTRQVLKIIKKPGSA